MFSIVFQLFGWLFSKHSRCSNKAEQADADDLSIGLDALHGVLRSLKTASWLPKAQRHCWANVQIPRWMAQPVEEEVNSKSWLLWFDDSVGLQSSPTPLFALGLFWCVAWLLVSCQKSLFQFSDSWAVKKKPCAVPFKVHREIPVFRLLDFHHRELVGRKTKAVLRRCTTTRTSSAFSPSPRSNEGMVWDLVITGSGRCEWSC